MKAESEMRVGVQVFCFVFLGGGGGLGGWVFEVMGCGGLKLEGFGGLESRVEDNVPSARNGLTTEEEGT